MNPSNAHANSAVSAVFSKGRSGSTWLGSVLNTHPDVAYRFEPFHRLRGRRRLEQFRARVKSPELTDADLAPLAAYLRRADPLTDKPPFFRKTGTRQFGKARLWPVARALRPLAPLFASVYAPPPDTRVIFKEVTMERVMRNLIERTSMPIVYLLRHPCAVTRSIVHGQSLGVMTGGRRKVIRQLLEDHHPELAAVWGERAPDLPELEQEALLWRFDTEIGVQAIQGQDQAMLVYYEDLCRDGPALFPELFSHLGIEYRDETRDFLDRLYAEPGTKDADSGQAPSYFSVFRNPRSSADKWREQLSDEERRRVLAVVGESPVYRAGVERGVWSA